MKDKKEMGLFEAYANDPQKADLDIWGREVDPLTRRGFFKKSGLMAMVAVIGSNIPFADKMPGGLIPVALADKGKEFSVEGKDGLKYLSDKPINAETPAHLLDDDFTPAKHFFIRNNGVPPEMSTIDLKTWTLEIAGESCANPTKFTLDELKTRFKHHTYAMTMECGGNGRLEYSPPTKGNQWTTGGVGCAKWTGVKLKDILHACGLKDDAQYIGYYGRDVHLSGDPTKVVISRGVPISKAMQDEVLVAWAMNGEDIPYQNGYPLRLCIGGWPASVSGKWLAKIVVRNKQHDGEKMVGSYTVPCTPIAPGAKNPESNECVIQAMPVKSLITFPKSGIEHKLSDKLTIRGKAWAGDLSVKKMEVSIDFGATWHKATVQKPINKTAWQKFEANVKFPTVGYYEVWAKATDDKGVSQPMVVPGWNSHGYLNNACHRIAVQVI